MSEERRGDWIQTYTGRVFWPLDPRPDEVCIADIAHSLANQCRFAGHCLEFYSVAQHSVLVSNSLPRSLLDERQCGLLHDAAEAYLVDLPRPVKREVVGYAEAEYRVMEAIAQHFDVPVQLPMVKGADNEAIATEQRDIMAHCDRRWSCMVNPWTAQIEPVGPEDAERMFLELACVLELRGAREAYNELLVRV